MVVGSFRSQQLQDPPHEPPVCMLEEIEKPEPMAELT